MKNAGKYDIIIVYIKTFLEDEMPKEKLSAKKKIIIALCTILGVLLVLYLLTVIIPMISSRQVEDQTEYVADFDFYPANYDEDIFLDEAYMKLISRGMLEFDDGLNTVITVSEDNISECGDYASVVANMLYSVRDGNVDEYNSYFNDEYYKTNSKKEDFTPQKIYDARLSVFLTETVEENKISYTKYVYKLEYKIYENNGTYRKDIGDGSRAQYIYVTNRSGTPLIEAIKYANSK